MTADGARARAGAEVKRGRGARHMPRLTSVHLDTREASMLGGGGGRGEGEGEREGGDEWEGVKRARGWEKGWEKERGRGKERKREGDGGEGVGEGEREGGGEWEGVKRGRGWEGERGKG